MKKSKEVSMILGGVGGAIANGGRSLGALLTTTALVTAMPAHAQDEASSASGSGIDTITVTAQKRAENLQEVPLAITAFSGEALSARGINNPQDLQHNVPSLVFSDNLSGVGVVTLRGVGGAANRGSQPARNPAVPVHVNGVYLQSPAIMLQDFLDIERVEVLRGPQGTLYGRNAVGGNINIITKRPTAEVEGEIGVEIGNYDQRRVHGALSGPLTDRLRGRVAFALQDRDGFVENVSDPNDDEKLTGDYSSVRATLEYDVTDDILVSVTGYDYRRDGVSYTLRPRALPSGPTAGIYALVPPGYVPASALDVQTVSHDTPEDGFDETTGVTGEITWDLGDVTFKSISGYFEMETFNFTDGDGTDLPNVRVVGGLNQFYDTFSQEIQLSSNGDGVFNWLLGGYFYDESSGGDGEFDGTSTAYNYFIVLGPGTAIEAKSYAVFGQGDLRITDDLTLTAGLRYTSDEMEVTRGLTFSAFGALAFPPVSGIVMDDSWDELTWKAGLDYALSDTALAYFSYSRGYKAGGFNVSDPFAPAFDPEILDAFEIGFKSLWYDQRLQVNGAAYYYDYSDKQELTSDATGFSVWENAGAATLFGAELELVGQVTDNFVFDASVSYINSEYDEYMTTDLENIALGVQDLSGNELTDAPEWQIHIGAQYTHQLDSGLGSLTLRGDHSYTDDKFVRPFNLATDRLDSYHRTNAQLSWLSDDGDWEAVLYVNNLENNDVINAFSETSPFVGFLHLEAYLPPRTYGFKLKHSF